MSCTDRLKPKQNRICPIVHLKPPKIFRKKCATNLSELTGYELVDFSLLFYRLLGLIHQLFYVLHAGKKRTNVSK